MASFRALILTGLAMAAFAGNSLLGRAALRDTDIDAGSFTSIRLIAGALVLWLLVAWRSGYRTGLAYGSWGSALALFAYAAAFSYAYDGLPTATGALLLFGAVQATMIAIGIVRGERPRPMQWLGFLVAFAGLVALLLPGLSAPPLGSAVLMLVAGVAWGWYSLQARGVSNPTAVTAGNFIRSVPMTVALSAAMLASARLDAAGSVYALASGALTSALGYAIWYQAIPLLQPTVTATVQLSVPVIAAVGGVLLLDEPLTLRLIVAGSAILGGIAVVILERRQSG